MSQSTPAHKQVIEVDVKGQHQPGSSPEVKHRLSSTPPRALSTEQIEANLKNAEVNRESYLDQRREKAQTENKKLIDHLERVEKQTEELNKKLQAEQEQAERNREALLQQKVEKGHAEVAHAKEVSARMKASQ
eukprot:TRINITY_DN218_c0_g1_i3.p1 TRINITY_DN218_c0_g1~~TRINITY_DN218_c0_g1_i3.p1  ORF type:complete len:133 (+),score=37.33 TRINITY_DN218_c0_g1_i3:395-793(+)